MVVAEVQTVKVPRFDARKPSSGISSRVKKANSRHGGFAERLLRSVLWRRGLRFRKHFAELPGKPDIVFRQQRLCVFVDGDFWHGRDWDALRTKLHERANADYWIPKIARNRQRDAEQIELIVSLGWKVVRLWETDVLSDVASSADLIQHHLETLERERSRNGSLPNLSSLMS